MIAEKYCWRCETTKGAECYYANKTAPDGLQSTCKTCQIAYGKKWKEVHPEKHREHVRNRKKTDAWRKSHNASRMAHIKRYPEKIRAQRQVRIAITYGRLTRLPCEVCGEVKSEGHHDDYTKPLDVRWLCRTHHLEHHKIQSEKNKNVQKEN